MDLYAGLTTKTLQNMVRHSHVFVTFNISHCQRYPYNWTILFESDNKYVACIDRHKHALNCLRDAKIQFKVHAQNRGYANITEYSIKENSS